MLNDANSFVDRLGIYFWVFLVAIVGALLNIGARKDKSTRRKIGGLITGALTSCFFGWISFEVIRHIHQSEQVALAGCGFFAWKGAEWINALLDKVIDSRLKKRDSGWGDRYSDYDDMPPMPRNINDER